MTQPQASSAQHGIRDGSTLNGYNVAMTQGRAIHRPTKSLVPAVAVRYGKYIRLR